MIEVIRGTTPTVKYRFKIVDVEDITSASLTIEQCGLLIDKPLSEALKEDNCLIWRLEQAETLSLGTGRASMQVNWLLEDGTRGASKELALAIKNNQKDEVMYETETT